ncbi:MAG: hypothetical protein RJB39_203 [Candidatus Parcubacteria bacterium]|jgi:hypothetical protein
MESHEYIAHIGRHLSQDVIQAAPGLQNRPFTLTNIGALMWPYETVLKIRFDGEDYDRLCIITGLLMVLEQFGRRYTFNSNGCPVIVLTPAQIATTPAFHREFTVTEGQPLEGGVLIYFRFTGEEKDYAIFYPAGADCGQRPFKGYRYWFDHRGKFLADEDSVP